MSGPIRTLYKVWWMEGGYKQFDTLEEAMAAEHPAKGKPWRIDKVEIGVWIDPNTVLS